MTIWILIAGLVAGVLIGAYRLMVLVGLMFCVSVATRLLQNSTFIVALGLSIKDIVIFQIGYFAAIALRSLVFRLLPRFAGKLERIKLREREKGPYDDRGVEP